MAAPTPRPWTVLRNDPIEKLEDNLWAVQGDLPQGTLRRRMVLVRLTDGRVIVHGAIALDDAAMAAIEAWGEPAFLFVPNRFHRLDAHAYKARYPKLCVVCPAGATNAVAKVVPVDGALGALPADASLRVEPLDGSAEREAVFVVRHADGRATVVFNDVVFNQPHLRGLEGLVLRAMGSTGGPRVTRIARVAFARDGRALGAQLRRLADEPGLARVVVAHGEHIAADVPRVLRGVADAL